jgi:Carboxypeptidase regulatory-like domain
MPLRVPVGRLRSPGTVTGSVLDAESGSAVSGALVRLGSAAALSDADGRVSFRGLPAGEYRVAVAQQGSASDAVVTGNPRVVIDSAHPRPAPFRVTVSRGASVEGRVVQRISAKTGLNGEADSLEAPTALANISIALIAGSDTIFSATDREGRYSFTDIRAGEWTITVLTEAPPQFRYDRESAALKLHAGESAIADFQLLPRKRQIRILEDAEAPAIPVPNTSRK